MLTQSGYRLTNENAAVCSGRAPHPPGRPVTSWRPKPGELQAIDLFDAVDRRDEVAARRTRLVARPVSDACDSCRWQQCRASKVAREREGTRASWLGLYVSYSDVDFLGSCLGEAAV